MHTHTQACLPTYARTHAHVTHRYGRICTPCELCNRAKEYLEFADEQKEVVGTCLMLMATTPACRYTPPHGKSIVMLEHKSCPSPAKISQPSSILRRVNSNVGNTGAKKTDIW